MGTTRNGIESAAGPVAALILFAASCAGSESKPSEDGDVVAAGAVPETGAGAEGDPGTAAEVAAETAPPRPEPEPPDAEGSPDLPEVGAPEPGADAAGETETAPLDDAPDAAETVVAADGDAGDAGSSEDGGAPLEPEGPPPPDRHVLFLGNSYTFYNDLPALVAGLAAAGGYGGAFETDSVTKGGAILEDHLYDPPTMEEVGSGDFTEVVLQEGSTVPVVAPFTFTYAAGELASAVHVAGGVPYFFETWARQEGHPDYQGSLAGYTPETMQETLREAYQKAAADHAGVYVPAGDAWEAALAAHPEIPLFDPDGSHPSPSGSYLVACVFHVVLTGLPAAVLPVEADGVEPAHAELLQAVADEIAAPGAVP